MDSVYTSIILASGLSERMGKPKALLPWDKSTTFIEKIINEYTKASCNRIICLVNEKTEPLCRALDIKSNVKFVINEHPEWGRFYSIRMASQEVKDDGFCFIQNVDNPFVSVDIIEMLYAKRKADSWCSPVYNGRGGHPVLLPKVIINKISQLSDNNHTLLDILKPYQRINVEIDSDTILRNINTPEDYCKYFNGKL